MMQINELKNNHHADVLIGAFIKNIWLKKKCLIAELVPICQLLSIYIGIKCLFQCEIKVRTNFLRHSNVQKILENKVVYFAVVVLKLWEIYISIIFGANYLV